MSYIFVQIHTKKWHAFLRNATSSLCSHSTLGDLERHPAKQISIVLPAGASLCEICKQKLPTDLVPHTVVLNAGMRAWLAVIGKQLVSMHARLPTKALEALAERVALIGTPTFPEAIEVYTRLKALLLNPREFSTNGRTIHTFPKIQDALEVLPPDPQAILHVTKAIQTWQTVTGRSVIGRGDKYNPVTVITSILKVSNPEAWIRYLSGKGLTALAVIFHPDTIVNHCKDAAVRGIFGGSTDYWAATQKQLDAQTIKE